MKHLPFNDNDWAHTGGYDIDSGVEAVADELMDIHLRIHPDHPPGPSQEHPTHLSQFEPLQGMAGPAPTMASPALILSRP